MTTLAKHALTVYLVKEGKDLSQTIPDYETLNHQTFQAGDQAYELYSKETFPRTPKWANFLPDDVDKDLLGKASSPGAILLTTVAGRQYALTFGSGRFFLDEDAREEDFGLKIVLNSVEKVWSIDKDSFDAINAKTRTQASKDSSIGEFGIDVEKDLLKAVTGIPTDKSLGVRISGIDGFHACPPIDIYELPTFLEKIQTLSQLDTYKNGEFAFINQIKPISEKGLIEKLDGFVVEKLSTLPVADTGVEMILPTIVDFSELVYFRYEHRPRNPVNLRLLDVQSFLEAAARLKWPITIETLRSKIVYATHADDSASVLGKVYKCLLAEIDHDGQQYILSGGKWYAIEKGYMAKVNEFYADSPRYPGHLPVFGKGITKTEYHEGDYNADVASNDTDIHCFDKEFIRPERNQKFEFCDLYGYKDGFEDLIHVKIGKSSAALSHMFAQGLISAEAFKEFPECRKQLNEKLLTPRGLTLLDPDAEIDQKKYRIVYAIIRKKGQPLPFFSKVNLRQAFRSLRNWSYYPYLAEIDIDETWALTKTVTKSAKKGKK